MNQDRTEMRDELKQHAKWARHDGERRWTVGLRTPVNPELLAWLAANYQVHDAKPLGGTLVLMVWSNRSTVGALMELPKPRGGSRHESNLVSW